MAFFTYLLITRLLILRKINSLNSGLLHRRPQTQHGCNFSSSQPLSFWRCNNSPPPDIAPSAGVIASPFFSLSLPLPALRDAVRKGGRRRLSVSSHMTLLANHPEPPSQSSHSSCQNVSIWFVTLPVPRREKSCFNFLPGSAQS